ncbi:flavodoxin-dependent (E)-4-hydroxy-3-methylbut-2-enyl-diphosphate synthase [bacterium]|nr:flavodoxin-dependent (E)-4-hydroxy-3-methylbut-2-enyl-diphosphate synthase [bacterium]
MDPQASEQRPTNVNQSQADGSAPAAPPTASLAPGSSMRASGIGLGTAQSPPAHYPQRRSVSVGGVQIGGGAPCVIQSMTTTPTRDWEATLAQVIRLADAGCQLVRLSVPDEASAVGFGEVKKRSPVPLIADVHFHHRMALRSIEEGADKIRLNPGNVTRREHIEEVAKELLAARIPVRVGSNSGSIAPRYKTQYVPDPVGAIVGSAREYVEQLREFGVEDIVVALKSHDPMTTVECYRRFAATEPWPLHIGVTEAGPGITGAARSAVALGLLLSEGIGDTMRVSLANDPVEEVYVCREILASLNLRKTVRVVACPTCARVEFDLLGLVERLEKPLLSLDAPISIAIMGCAVNGPGEARDADIGICAAGGRYMLFKKGEIVRSDLTEADFAGVLSDEIFEMTGKRLAL